MWFSLSEHSFSFTAGSRGLTVLAHGVSTVEPPGRLEKGSCVPVIWVWGQGWYAFDQGRGKGPKSVATLQPCCGMRMEWGTCSLEAGFWMLLPAIWGFKTGKMENRVHRGIREALPRII